MSAKVLQYDPHLHKLFVYGIFLAEVRRQQYGMTNPRYATVRDYLTIGDYIVQAHHVPGADLALTGLLVDVPTNYDWKPLDQLEGGYNRTIVTTTDGERAYIYVSPVIQGESE